MNSKLNVLKLQSKKVKRIQKHLRLFIWNYTFWSFWNSLKKCSLLEKWFLENLWWVPSTDQRQLRKCKLVLVGDRERETPEPTFQTSPSWRCVRATPPEEVQRRGIGFPMSPVDWVTLNNLGNKQTIKRVQDNKVGRWRFSINS